VVDISSRTGKSILTGWRISPLVGVFTVSIFLSALLLFSVQPMFAKLTLPLLGGSSNVWNTAMVFFQAMLLGGYIYAHLITKYLKLRWQVLTHGIVLSAGFLFLPLSIAAGWTPPAGGAQAYWLMALFAVSIGVPFFAISANAPLLQRWFSYTGHKDADDPYFLYAASNAGSLISLCLYPVWFEPFMQLREQTFLWSNGYILLVIAIIGAGLTARLFRNDRGHATAAKPVDTRSIAGRDGAKVKGLPVLWVFFAFIPSSLMLGVTSHITTNVSSAPLLWIVPLSLYLLTFIIVFAKAPMITPARLRLLFPAVIIVALVAGMFLKEKIILSISLSLVCYFLIALLCHGRLVEARPGTNRLTEFYIWMSVGGVLGGIFNALVAPIIFADIYEYFFVLALAQLAVPTKQKRGIASQAETLKTVILYTALAVAQFSLLTKMGMAVKFPMALAIAIVFFGVWRSKFAGPALVIPATALITAALFWPITNDVVRKDRSFFGVVQTHQDTHELGKVHSLVNGDTIHNFQLRAPELQKIPLAYYAEGNSFHTALMAVRGENKPLHVAMIGLGAGAMACYEQAGDTWTYFEIDPTVVKAATNPALFSYMDQCSQASDIRLGDARLTISQLAANSQDFIVIDAFTSDSIPAHLVTREALALYRSRLKPDGILFFHTSNRVADIASVVVNLAEDAGLKSAYYNMDMAVFESLAYADLIHKSHGVLVGREAEILPIMASNSNWHEFVPSPSVGLWTDDYSSILGPLRSHALKEYQVK